MAELTNERLERKIRLSHWALVWERIWAAACWPVVLGIGLFSLVWSGLLLQIPSAAAWALIIAGLVAFGWTCRKLFRLQWPTRYDAMRRLERDSELGNRAVSSRNDALADSITDETSKLIWEEHKRRQWSLMGALKVALPQSRWRDIDGYALRVPAALALVAAFFLAPPASLQNLAGNLNVAPAEAAKPVTLDAWLKPPAYTAQRPILLTSPAQTAALKQNPQLTVPSNSQLTLRLNGAKAPKISFADASGEIKDHGAKIKFAEGVFTVDAKLTKPATIKILDGDTEMAQWAFTLTPDNPPQIAITGTPAEDAVGPLAMKWKATDDYGVTRVTAKVELSDEQDDGLGFTGNGVFLFDPPEMKIAMRKSSPKMEEGTTNADLTSHPWAGFMVDVTFTAKDGASQTANSETKRIRLPERVFGKPLARALIEQRKILIMDTENAGEASNLLKAILIYPEGLVERSGIHIALASVISRLDNIRGPDDYQESVKALWDVAVMIEDGMIGDAKDQLQAAKKALEDAIRRGASPEELKQLTQKLREAMNRYLDQMVREAQKNPQGQQQGNQNGQQVNKQDLQKMLDDIQKLAEGGAKDQAQQLLSELDRMLNNMQIGQNQQGDQQGDQAAREMMNQLSEMMRKQQQLMDETQRMQPGQGEQGEMDSLNPEGDDPGNRSGNQGQGNLPGRQGDLQKMLEQMLGQMGQNGMKPPQQLGDAGKNMGNAKGALEGQERDQALGEQGEALKNLREGAKSLGQQLGKQRGRSQNADGQDGPGMNGDDRDPLGRPTKSSGEDRGPERDMLPSELAIRRAQEILESLRNRANSSELPKIDRDYIERLLRGLY
jgi:uncharacterized protein (TIGR02302 family)